MTHLILKEFKWDKIEHLTLFRATLFLVRGETGKQYTGTPSPGQFSNYKIPHCLRALKRQPWTNKLTWENNDTPELLTYSQLWALLRN